MTDTTKLLARRALQHNPSAQAAFLASLGVDVAGMAYARKLSLFCDPAVPAASHAQRPPIARLFDQLQPAATPTLCLVPPGVADAGATRGGLTIHVLPAFDQDTHERLLWCCDFNFIHGADAHTPARAQAAGRPFIWHAGEAGQPAAFLERYSAALPPHAADTLRAASAAWNNDGDNYRALAACLAGPVNRTLTLHAQQLASS